MLRGDAWQPLRGDECPAAEDTAEARLAQIAQFCGVSIPVLKCRPYGGLVERLTNGALDAVRSKKDITCCSGPILEAQHNRVAWSLDVTVEALRWRGTATWGQAI